MRPIPLLYISMICLLTFMITFQAFAVDCYTAKQIYRQAVKTLDYKNKTILYQKSIDLCPHYAEAYNNLADALEHMGNYDEAIEKYKKALKLKPDLAASYFGLGDIYLKTGLFGKAIEAYEAGLQLDPSDQLALSGLESSRKNASFVSISGQLNHQTIIDTIKGNSIKTMGPGGVRQRISRITFHNILFDFGSSRIKSNSFSQLNEIGQALSSTELKHFRFIIEGHTDNVGIEEYNQKLSEMRAHSVKHYIEKTFSIPNADLQIRGYGESRPVAENTTIKGRALNRRVEIVAITQ